MNDIHRQTSTSAIDAVLYWGQPGSEVKVTRGNSGAVLGKYASVLRAGDWMLATVC
jgi:hypothetical protein